MSKNRSMVYLLIRNVMLSFVVALAIGAIITEKPLYYFYGLGLGTLVTVAKVLLMGHTFKRAVIKQAHQAIGFTKAQYFLRYIITFVVLIVGVIVPEIHIVGLTIGLLLLKPAAYIQGRLEPPVPKDGTVEFREWEDDEEEKSDFW